MKTFLVEFFDLKNNWHGDMRVEATSETNAKDIARKMLGRGFCRFTAWELSEVTA